MNIHEIQFTSSPGIKSTQNKEDKGKEIKSENFLTIVIIIEFDRVDKLIKSEGLFWGKQSSWASPGLEDSFNK